LRNSQPPPEGGSATTTGGAVPKSNALSLNALVENADDENEATG
jgi:hypothetical protein